MKILAYLESIDVTQSQQIWDLSTTANLLGVEATADIKFDAIRELFSVTHTIVANSFHRTTSVLRQYNILVGR